MRNPFGPTAAELRQSAMICAAEAAVAKTPEERDALLRKRKSLLALADTEDWLNGQRPFLDKIASATPAE